MKTIKRFIIGFILSLGFALPLWVIEYFVHDNSNIPFTTCSFFLILFVSYTYLVKENTNTLETMIGFALVIILYSLYFSHDWKVYLILFSIILFVILLGTWIVLLNKWKNRKRTKVLKELYPLQAKTLKANEIEALSSLYGSKGYFYKVIQSGKIEGKDIKAINAKLRRKLNIPKP